MEEFEFVVVPMGSMAALSDVAGGSITGMVAGTELDFEGGRASGQERAVLVLELARSSVRLLDLTIFAGTFVAGFGWLSGGRGVEGYKGTSGQALVNASACNATVAASINKTNRVK